MNEIVETAPSINYKLLYERSPLSYQSLDANGNFLIVKDYLKIDGQFVKDVETDPIDLAMLKSINEIGHVMGKKTIAEFVENGEILEVLGGLGVDYAQGYPIGRPAPIDDLLS